MEPPAGWVSLPPDIQCIVVCVALGRAAARAVCRAFCDAVDASTEGLVADASSCSSFSTFSSSKRYMGTSTAAHPAPTIPPPAAPAPTAPSPTSPFLVQSPPPAHHTYGGASHFYPATGFISSSAAAAVAHQVQLRLTRFPRLSHLSVRMTCGTRAALHLSDCPPCLHHLRVDGDWHITVLSAPPPPLPHLRSLHLSHINLCHTLPLASLPRLTSLSLRGCRGVPPLAFGAPCSSAASTPGGGASATAAATVTSATAAASGPSPSSSSSSSFPASLTTSSVTAAAAAAAVAGAGAAAAAAAGAGAAVAAVAAGAGTAAAAGAGAHAGGAAGAAGALTHHHRHASSTPSQLQHLDVSGSDVPSLDLSTCPSLTHLDVSNASSLPPFVLDSTTPQGLTFLKVCGTATLGLALQHAPYLTHLEFGHTRVGVLDCRPCGNLRFVGARAGALHSITLTHSIRHLDLYRSRVAGLDLTLTHDLTHLNAEGTEISSLDLTPCAGSLQQLHVSQTGLEVLEGLSVCHALRQLHAAATDLAAVDASGCVHLRVLDLSHNTALTTLLVHQDVELVELDVSHTALEPEFADALCIAAGVPPPRVLVSLPLPVGGQAAALMTDQAQEGIQFWKHIQIWQRACTLGPLKWLPVGVVRGLYSGSMLLLRVVQVPAAGAD